MPGKTFRQKLRSKNNKQSKKNHSNNKKSRKQLKGGMKVHVPITRITSKLSDSKLAELTPQEFQEYARNRLSYLNRKTNAAKKRDMIAKQELTAATQARDAKIERKEAIAEMPYLMEQAEIARLEQERQEKEEEKRQETLDAQSRAAYLAQSRSTAKERQNIQDRKSNILGIQYQYVLAMAEPRYLKRDEIIRRYPATEIFKDMLDKQFTAKKKEIIADRSLDDPDVLAEVEVRFKEYLDSEYKKRDEYTDMYDHISKEEGVKISNQRVAAERARHQGRGGSQ